ncbi:unnamed protein product [Candida verbasci]|uniref:Protein YIP n=1 Tax=Candida verbasci TaxID=1227364 RepID=A0A9W4TYX3_9ASCO|nr:unnamed protein product [Candida verbasci]
MTENNQYQQQQSSSTFPNFFVPKIDLSSSFKPFIQNDNKNGHQKIREREYKGGNTLDESVLSTLKRDGIQIARRLYIIVWPMQLAKLAKTQQTKFLNFANQNGINIPIPDGNEDENQFSGDLDLQENLHWDLWGPLLFSLIYSTVLATSSSQANTVFTGSFSFIWIFYIIIGLNVQLLGGTISFLSAISAIGYSMFPIVLGELFCSLLIKWRLIRLFLVIILDIWSIYVGVMSVKCSGVYPGRVLLAMYPVGLFYTLLSWLSIIT